MKLKSNAKYNVPVENGTIYEAKINDMRVSIHKIIGVEGWFLNCSKLGIMDKELESEDLFACVRESRKIMKDNLKALTEDVETFCIDEPIEIVRYI